MDVSIYELMNTVFSFTPTLMLTFFIREAQIITGTTYLDYFSLGSNAPDSGNIRKTGLKTDIFIYLCNKYLLAEFVDHLEVFEVIYIIISAFLEIN